MGYLEYLTQILPSLIGLSVCKIAETFLDYRKGTKSLHVFPDPPDDSGLASR